MPSHVGSAAFLGKVCHGTRFSVTHVADVVARNAEVAPGHLVW